jgi:hypothetical protein
MTIGELIEILEQHPNKDAQVVIRFNEKNPDDEDSDITSTYIEVWDADNFYPDFVEIFTTPLM